MLESFKSGKFDYKRLSLEEQKSRCILGRLRGIIADTKNPTRNGRLYSRSLWEKVFSSDIMQEKIKNHLVLGELGHPTDREEIDIERAAICLAEQPKIGDDGNIYGVFDILSTPSGRILKSLCDYGCNIGVSSRGTGDLYTDENGNEAVDPDTYNCECFDAVVVPAVESARLQYVTESLDTKKHNKTLRQKLTEELDKASEADKKIMEESLEALNISLTEASDTRAWLVSQDGREIPQLVHTELKSNAIEDVISDDYIHDELLSYYNKTSSDEVRNMIIKLFSGIKKYDPSAIDEASLPFELVGKCSDNVNDLDYLYKLIFDSFNTEFMKVRYGGKYGDEGESEIYFRIASKNVN